MAIDRDRKPRGDEILGRKQREDSFSLKKGESRSAELERSKAPIEADYVPKKGPAEHVGHDSATYHATQEAHDNASRLSGVESAKRPSPTPYAHPAAQTLGWQLGPVREGSNPGRETPYPDPSPTPAISSGDTAVIRPRPQAGSDRAPHGKDSDEFLSEAHDGAADLIMEGPEEGLTIRRGADELVSGSPAATLIADVGNPKAASTLNPRAATAAVTARIEATSRKGTKRRTGKADSQDKAPSDPKRSKLSQARKAATTLRKEAASSLESMETDDTAGEALTGAVGTAEKTHDAATTVRVAVGSAHELYVTPQRRSEKTLERLYGRTKKTDALLAKNSDKLRLEERKLKLQVIRKKSVPEYERKLTEGRVKRLRRRNERLRRRQLRLRGGGGSRLSKLGTLRAKIAAKLSSGGLWAAAAGVAACVAAVLVIPAFIAFFVVGNGNIGDSSGVGDLTGDVAVLARFLKEEMGMTNAQAAGIIGNAVIESFDGGWQEGHPLGIGWDAREKGGTGIGFVQFSFGEAQSLRDYASQKGMDWVNPEVQMSFFKDVSWGHMWITQTARRWAAGNNLTAEQAATVCGKSEFMACDVPETCALIFQCGYERGTYSSANHLQARMACARYVYTQISRRGGGGSGVGAAVLAKARENIGMPYVWGGGHGDYASNPKPHGVDCSGLVLWAYYNGAGIDIPACGGGYHVATYAEAARAGKCWKIISKSALEPGDIIIKTGGTDSQDHVRIYAGIDKQGHHHTVESGGGGGGTWENTNYDLNGQAAWGYNLFLRWDGPVSDKVSARSSRRSRLKAGNGTPETGDAARDKIMANALSQVGLPYIWGGKTEGVGFDCSGLASWAYEKAGVSVGGNRTTYTLIPWIKSRGNWKTSVAELKPGDMVFPSTGHVQIYLGNGKVVHAPSPGRVLEVTNVSGYIYGGGWAG